jgi:hypothetical protein
MRYTTATPATGGSRGDRAQYPDTMAYMAVEAMVKKLNGETAPEKTIHRSSLSQRTTCRMPANTTKTNRSKDETTWSTIYL